MLLGDTKQFCCGFDWNFVSELEQKQSILYYKLWTLCLLHSQWITSTPTTCLHADGSVSVPSKRTGSVRDDIKVPREWFEFGKHAEHLLSVALAVLWCHTAIVLCGAASSRTEKGNLVEHTPVYELLSLRPDPPPPPKKNSSDLDDSHKWPILIQNGEFRRKATSLQVWKREKNDFGKRRMRTRVTRVKNTWNVFILPSFVMLWH